jgi:hypothetical protein
MTDQHPITPPLELVHQWADMLASRSDQAVFTMAAQWGSNQELEACCEVLDNLNEGSWSKYIRVARRPTPKPPSLKEQALRYLNQAYNKDQIDDTTFENIQEALEALPND